MISMITNRSDLYHRLWIDYSERSSDSKQDSFFYQYLKAKKDAQAERVAESVSTLADYAARKKGDNYIQLRSAYIAYKNNILSEKEYIERFTKLTGAKDSKKYEPFTDDLIDEAEQTFENKFLLGCVKNFFYNLGYRVRENKDKNIVIDDIGYAKISERYIKEKDGYIDDLELWAHYYIHSLKGEAQPPKFVSELTNDYIDKCRHLFSVLNQKKYSKAFVPLYFDSASGAGVIIIGEDMLSTKQKSDKTCRICIASFCMLTDGISDSNALDITMATEMYDDVDKAFEEFKDGIAKYKYTENYQSENDLLPIGVDSIFNNFFYETEEMQTPAYNRIIETENNLERAVLLEFAQKRDKQIGRISRTK